MAQMLFRQNMLNVCIHPVLLIQFIVRPSIQEAQVMNKIKTQHLINRTTTKAQPKLHCGSVNH